MQKLNLPDGLYMRPARDSDNPFIEQLYKTTRDDLRMADGESGFIEELIDMQHRAQTVGYGDKFPNAMYFIIEKHNERVGRVVVDFGPNEIRIVDLALLPKARGLGFGKGIIQSLQTASASAGAPLLLSVENINVGAKRLYASLGFQLEESSEIYDLLIWYPTQPILRGI
ncbi:GNAT family N-acetyltransferase [Pseudomonadota bacterium]